MKISLLTAAGLLALGALSTAGANGPPAPLDPPPEEPCTIETASTTRALPGEGNGCANR